MNRRRPNGQTRVQGVMADGMFLWLMGEERQEGVEEEGGEKGVKYLRLVWLGWPRLWHRLAARSADARAWAWAWAWAGGRGTLS